MLVSQMNDIGVATGIISLVVMLSFFAFIVFYLWYLRRSLDKLDRNLAKLRDMFASGAGYDLIQEFLSSLGRRSGIKVLNELLEQDCYASTHPRIGDIRKLAEAAGVLASARNAMKAGNQWKRAVAIRTLSVLDDRQSIPLVLEALDKRDFKPELFAAAVSLARFGEHGYAAKAMKKIYDERQHNRDMLLSVLTEFGARESGIVDMLEAADIPDDFKGAVADVIGVQRIMEYRPLVEKLLSSANDPELKLHLLEALEKIGVESSCGLVVKFLPDADFRVRLKALNALERLAGDKYIDDILKMLSDSDVFVRRNAAEAVSRMGARGLSVLEEISKTGSEEIKRIISVVLAEKKFKRMRWRFRYGESYT